MGDDFRYDELRQVVTSADGKEAYLTFVKGGDALTVAVPASDLPKAAVALLLGSAEAAAKAGSNASERSVHVNRASILTIPDGARLLKIGIHGGAAPLSLRLTRDQLVELARAILASEGETSPDRTESVQ